MKTNIVSSILLFLITLYGCSDTTGPTAYKQEVVVNALIYAGRTIDTVKIQWTGDVAKFYDPAQYAIPGAVVKVSGIGFLFEDSLVYDPLNPGRYYSTDPTKIIEATKSYRLYIQTPDGRVITGETTVPDTFRITFSTLSAGDTVTYDPYAPLHLVEWSPSRFHGTYLPTVESLDPNAALIPKFFERDTINNPKPQKIGYRIGLPKEQTNTILPWLFLTYFGTTAIDIYAIDENYNDFLSQLIPAQGGELSEIRYRLNGGIGVFGSATQATGGFTIYLKP
ncbi:MAG: DUF4249 family protein [Bacteroidota bacterium]